jgi:hypothetical protein
MSKRTAMVVGALVLASGTFGCAAEAGSDDLATESDALVRANPRLAEFQEIYTRWSFGQLSVPSDSNGNAVVRDVVLMPIPFTPGDGTPGVADVALKAGQSFMLPCFAEFGTSYRDSTPPDPFEPLSLFTTLDIKFSVDGVPLVTTANVLGYFSKFTFKPEIPIDDTFIKAVIWFEGVGVLHTPLTPGKHVLKLDEKNTEPGFGGLLEYHNTWNVTVAARH